MGLGFVGGFGFRVSGACCTSGGVSGLRHLTKVAESPFFWLKRVVSFFPNPSGTYYL